MAGKKTFAGQANPAMAYISHPQEPEIDLKGDTATPATKAAGKAPKARGKASPLKATGAPKGYKPNPLYVETKSRRMQLLVQPSLYEAIKARATAEGQSVNELVHTILEDAVMREGD